VQETDPAAHQTSPATTEGEAVNHSNQPSFHEELAAHLADQQAPKPHPESYQHGYPRIEKTPQHGFITDTTTQALISQLGRMNPRAFVTEQDARINRELDDEAIRILRARADAAQQKLVALGLDTKKPTGPVNETIQPQAPKWMRTFWIGYVAVVASAILLGAVRGCAA
jgi:hypothetical protein